MKKEEQKKLNKIASKILETDKLIKDIKNNFRLKEAKKFATSSHICLLNGDIGDKFLLIKVSEEQYRELSKKKQI